MSNQNDENPNAAMNVWKAVTSADEHIMLGPAQWSGWEQQHLLDPRERFFRWNEVPDASEQMTVRALRILTEGGEPKEFPSRISQLPNLNKIEIPHHMVADLIQTSIPSTVKTLIIKGTGSATWPRGVVLSNVESLLSIGGVKLVFDRKNFPSVRRLALTIDAHEKRLSLVSQYPSLVELTIMNVSTDSLFSLTSLAHLRTLAISGGRLSSLANVRLLQGLEHLAVGILPKLTRLEGVQWLERLSALKVAYCGNLVDVSQVLSAHALRRFELVGCKKTNVAEIRAKLDAMKLDVLSVIAS